METSLNMLILDKDLSLYDLIKHSSMMDKYNIYFTDTHEDMLVTIKKSDISIIICDVDGDTEKAKVILTELKKFDALLDVIIVGKTLPPEEMIEIIRLGAKDYLDKPLYLPVIHKILKEITDKKTLRKETYQLEKKLEKKYVFHGIVGKSPYMLEIFSLIEKIAKYFTSILITGETGSGKELIAQAIHELSQSKKNKLVICDCAAIPDNLFESELFGYTKGAFTGADITKKGLFEEAHQGIIFLDELAEIPLPIQSKLLRVLESHQFRPLGSNTLTNVDVKVITATNRNLRDMVDNGTFREDLFHRLNKVEIELPPLRERQEDIPLLVRYFVNHYRNRFSNEIKGISRRAQKLFLRHNWPGNIRELKNVIESASLVAKKDFLDIPDLPKNLQKVNTSDKTIPFINRENLSTLDELEKEYIVHLLKITSGNLRKTAGILNISRTTLYNKLKKYNISKGG
jgi:DNA-binding NtrC family response regulator